MGTVGLIGIGRLGSAIAQRLLTAGFTVIGHDADPARLAAFEAAGGIAGSPAACDRVILCLPSHAAARDAARTLAARICIDTTNAEPEESEALAAELAARAIAYLDAPVCEWSETVRARGGKVVCGGDPQAVAACADIFAAFARPLIHAGASGAGTRKKRELEFAARQSSPAQ